MFYLINGIKTYPASNSNHEPQHDEKATSHYFKIDMVRYRIYEFPDLYKFANE